ncbi:MAG: hypothetical protein AAGF20_09080 [Pseudomonadota bacterium]
MAHIAYLSSKVTLPGSPIRRDDAFEHDRTIAALEKPFAGRGLTLEAIDWAAEDENWTRFDAAMIGTTWDYWDHQAAFLARLDTIETQIPLFNAADLVRWNSHKGYLRSLAKQGARLIPTLWLETVTPETAAAAFDRLGSDTLVFKRQVGAGAAGQYKLNRGDALPPMPHAMMVQPFWATIQTEGELSFIFIDGGFCHALVKQAATGDYRIQSSYGGVETAITPSPQDLCAASDVLSALDATPLYARVDMLRGDDEALYLMELELIEPYLYPLEGPEFGPRLAAALARRLGLAS